MKSSRNASGANSVRLLLDTHVLIWIPTGDPRLSAAARDAMQHPQAELFTSAVTAFELTDLQRRGRIAMSENIATFAGPLGLSIVDFPAGAWAIAETLPRLHRDPVDRMMIAHAILGGFTLVTADKTIRRYPVETLW
jgi:PIN domain nuclease of toxin-antitoxin system